jgi:hypothetical protein
MTGFLRHIFFRVLDHLPFFRRRGEESGIPEELWEAGFSKPSRTHFDIKSENTYDAYLRGGCLGLGLKKTKCLAWVEGTRPYRDMILKARLRLDCGGGYGAAGIIFRMIDRGTYYLALLSSKGYFRLDAVRNNTPLALIGWTEFGEKPAVSPGPWEKELTIIASGPRIILLIDGLWAGEIDDSSINAGFLGLALASYEAGRSAYAAEAFLEYLSVDTRAAEVEAARLAWEDGPSGTEWTAGSRGAGPAPPRSIPGESRLRLAETFAALGENAAALGQL